MILLIHFYVKSTKGRTSPDINLEDLPGSAGRLDIIARCINSALWLSNSLRRDVVFHTILHGGPNAPIYIKIEGKNLKKVQPDERNISIFIKKAIGYYRDGSIIESTPGVFVSRKSFAELLEENKGNKFVFLSETGKFIGDAKEEIFSDNAFFILGDKEDLAPEEVKLIEKYKPSVISLGNNKYLASHCIAVINWTRDNRADNAKLL